MTNIQKELCQLRDDIEAQYAYLGLFSGQGMARSMLCGIISRIDSLTEQETKPNDETRKHPDQLEFSV